MKNIGVITFHGSHNYGSVLQAFALSKQLQLMGYNVKIINLRNINQKNAYKIFKKNQSFLHLCFTGIIYFKLKRRFAKYENFINNVLPLTSQEFSSGEELKAANLKFNIYICGGDQIWNPNCQDFEPAYFLDFVKDGAKKISYSPSLGKTEFDQKQLKTIQDLIQGFSNISVRESQGADILKKLTHIPISIVCDPVLLLEKKYWTQMAMKPRIKKPYILVYFLTNNHGNRNLISYFKKQTGYEVVILNEYIKDYFKSYHRAIDSSPQEFVGLFKNASLVYTNSFHGTLFATIFNKPFYTAIAKDENVNNNNDSRKIDFLERIGLQNRMISDSVPEKDEILSIDYFNANKKLEEFRIFSLDYLQNALEEEVD